MAKAHACPMRGPGSDSQHCQGKKGKKRNKERNGKERKERKAKASLSMKNSGHYLNQAKTTVFRYEQIQVPPELTGEITLLLKALAQYNIQGSPAPSAQDSLPQTGPKAIAQKYRFLAQGETIQQEGLQEGCDLKS